MCVYVCVYAYLHIAKCQFKAIEWNICPMQIACTNIILYPYRDLPSLV